ncbi:competence protein ComEC [Halorubrum alkaliphilum]|uniref:Competence protein ComEC n=1 Tax=Halorubrum alkaliphilum TaxID=261290 RepID=A0A8T4GJD0_9EURY|nr:ComEC/Rec2 family competence protein [Halorubrum alkaliphilum]MBP1923690.1 competence protein ComEC [Halorubrum alkaliphilum]
MRRALVIGAVALLVLLAGCASLPVDDGDIETDTPDTDNVDDGTETDDGSDDADDTDESSTDTDEPRDVDGELAVHHIDVGQADATLLITPAGETILIDSGDWRQGGEGVIEYLEAHDIDRIDHLVATHGHADHIGGHDAIIEWAETEGDGIGLAYDSGVAHTSQTYERYLDAVEEYDVELLIVEEGDELPIEDDVDGLVVNPPEGDSGTDLHDNSVALVIEFGEFRYVTTGDAETAAEERMVDSWAAELDADIYHAGHHGSSTSSTAPFLDAASPEIAIISSAYDSQYGHPHDEVLTRFADRDIDTYWTGVHGDIIVTATGDGEINITTSDTFSPDAEDLLGEKPSDDQESLTPLTVNTQHYGTIPV